MRKLILLGIFLLLCISFASALVLPENIQKIIAYNNQQASFYLENITFVIAFLAGLIAVLSPCTFAIVPMYFSYGLKEKSTMHTFSFFAGFTTIFILLGIVASTLGQSILLFQADNSFVILGAGILLVGFGAMQIFGKGFSFFPAKTFKAKNTLGVFVLGSLFAVGWTACTGPILAGVLLIASVFGSYVKVSLLMLFYALGNFVPFFLLSFAVDGFKLHEHPLVRGKILVFKLFGSQFTTHSTNIIGGVLLVFMGFLFILFRDTSLFNSINIANANLVGYSLQDSLLGSAWAYAIGFIVLVVFAVLTLYFLFRKR